MLQRFIAVVKLILGKSSRSLATFRTRLKFSCSILLQSIIFILKLLFLRLDFLELINERDKSVYLSVLQNIMLKTQKQIELQGKTHRKRHFKIKIPKPHSNIENKPRLIHSPIAK